MSYRHPDHHEEGDIVARLEDDTVSLWRVESFGFARSPQNKMIWRIRLKNIVTNERWDGPWRDSRVISLPELAQLANFGQSVLDEAISHI